jgi:histone-lysine N-methyltransferase SUV39H
MEFDLLLARIPGPKIKHINTRDSSTPSLHFRFVDSYLYGDGVEPPDPDLMIGCTSCKPNMGGFCGCEYTKRCECLEYARVDESKLDDIEKKRYEKVKREGGSTMGFPKNFPYAKETGLMVKAYLGHRYPIYECNDKCGCGEICKTRVVQKGRKVGLEIFKTKDRGWGLRCTENLQRGQFVDCYRGEVITTEEADRREGSAEKGKESYLFSLNKFDEVVDPLYVVDGEFVGGATRFVNHSCEPNCAQYAVCYDRNNPYIYDIAIFATTDIPKGEELTFDYMDVDFENEESKEGLEKMLEKKVEADSMPCRCGARNCRRWLWK